ncbi:3-isopropylmalate dehydratase small subunit [Bradyrhizobium sp.]|uniref:3-isopropylmalate dehydratase small subunit n=1 Tax=Bradyrhizobium sp. TaxID=376 RepID=UPI0040379B2C
MMEKFERLTAVAAPLLRDNIDTDVIIRIERLLGVVPRNDLGHWCFEALRYLTHGSENPDFVLNQPGYRGAAILLAGKNFGCGSSREGAVWALLQVGIRCVIAPSFGEIFFGNCFQNGLLPVVLGEADIRALAAEVERRPKASQLTVDLTRSRVEAPSGQRFEFSIAPMRREALLRGLDEIEMTLARSSDIADFQAADRRSRPWIYETVEH